jgi:hypothetical protein
LKFTIFSVKFLKFGKINFGNHSFLPGILKLKKMTFRKLEENENFHFPWKIVIGGKTPRNLLFFGVKLSILKK